MSTLTSQTTTRTLLEKTFHAQQQHAPTQKAAGAAGRIKKLRKLEELVLTWQDRIEEAVHQDFKKAHTETALTEVYKVLAETRKAVKHVRRWMKPKKVGTPLAFLGTKGRIVYEPKGVTLIIAPWNYPFSLAMSPLVSAIAAGNTVMLKPSEISNHTTSVMKAMLAEGFPEEEIAVIEGGVEVSQALLKLPFDHIFFTGSPAVGKIVMDAAAKNLSSVTLELGGKSPVFIDETADLQDAAEKLVWGKLVNNGQTCIAPDYLLINEKVEKAFLEKVRDCVSTYYGSDSEKIAQSPDYCRIINDKHTARLAGLIEDAVENGASVYLGGEVDAGQRFIAPTVLREVTAQHKIMQEEIFGPILPVLTYQDLGEAIALVNRLPKPLSLYAFSKKKRVLRRILHETTAGSTVFNDVMLQFSHDNLPFGGVNNSGIGKSHGKYGFLAFTNERSLLRQRIGLTGLKMFYPPYTARTKKLIDMLVKWL